MEGLKEKRVFIKSGREGVRNYKTGWSVRNSFKLKENFF